VMLLGRYMAVPLCACMSFKACFPHLNHRRRLDRCSLCTLSSLITWPERACYVVVWISERFCIRAWHLLVFSSFVDSDFPFWFSMAD
jgi:hypothetical protein